MRINKYLADRGIATRRAADELIASGKVYINGRRAELGTQVGEEDQVEVRRASPATYHYYLFNKPEGVITHSPQPGEEDIIDVLPKELQALGLFPVGRLDKASHGLMLLTNDGRVTDRLLSPNHAHEKEYQVRTKLPLSAKFKERMEQGVSIEGYVTKHAKVRILGEQSFSIILTEGKKHQIRRMVVALGNEVRELKRIRILMLSLGTLPKGRARALSDTERAQLLRALGLGV